jgi:curli biogenesis system outer membrane secretion channel CsgG
MKATKSLLILAAVLALFVSSVPTKTLAQAPPRKPRIAILDFDYGTVHSYVAQIFGQDIDIGKGISELLVTDLVNDGTYTLVERSALDKILAEQNFSTSGRADSSTAAKIGKILNVDAILIGTITQFGNEKKGFNTGGMGGNWGGFGGGGIGHSNTKANVGINARLINVETGEILAVAEGTGQSSRSSTSLTGGGGNWGGFGGGHVDFGSSDFQSTIIGEATKIATQGLATDLISKAGKVPTHVVTVEGLVAAADGGQIIINVGAKAGVKAGDQFQVSHVGKEIKDPATGAVIRRLTTPVGVIQAADVDDGSAVCNIVSGSGFATGDMVKSIAK